MNCMKKNNLLKQFFLKDENSHQLALEPVHNTILFEYALSLAKYHPDMIIVFSSDGEIIYINKEELYQILHYRPRHSEDFKKIFTEENYKRLKRAFHQTLRGKSEKLEIEMLQQDGGYKTLSLTFIPIKIDNHRSEGIYLIIEDITRLTELKNQFFLHEKHLNDAQHIAEAGSWEYFVKQDKLYCSDNFYRIFGFDQSSEDGIDKPFQFIHPHDYESTYQTFQQSLRQEKFDSEFRIYHGKTNELRYLKAVAEVIWKNNEPFKMVGVVKDNTAFKELEQALKDNIESYRYIFDNLDAGIWMRDSIRGKILYASQGLENILGIPLKTLYEDSEAWIKRIHPAHLQEVLEYTEYLALGKSYQVIYRLFYRDGSTKWLLEQIVPRLNEDGEVNHIFGLVTDITAEIEREEKLNFLVHYDELTGLPNHLSLYEKMDSFCQSMDPFAVLYIDINRFHVINQALGFQIGDEVLQFIAKRLSSLIPENGFIARLNSNYFIILIKKYSSKNNIYALANRILKSFEAMTIVRDYELHISASIGITFYPEEGLNRVTLLENAYSALCYAKQRGRNNYYVYSISDDISSYKQFVLDRDMHHVLLNEEFELYFQPLVEPQKGNIYGAEALIRWHHNEWGVVSPGEFIPLAEENHMIHTIADWVIRKACASLKEWRERGHVLRTIVINISPVRFMKKGFVELIKEQLALNDISAGYLELEITEGTLLKNSTSVLTTLLELQKLGVKIAIDDFGTGYSSLDSLRTFKPTSIKINRAFIRNIHHDHKIDNGLVSSTIYLAKMLEMKVVAEGVDSYEQYLFLKQQECDVVQGNIFSKPVSAAIFEKMLQKGFLTPQITKENKKPIVERRAYYRFNFPAFVMGTMTIIKINQKKVDIGNTPILIENISLGGMKIRSSLKLPINSRMTFKFSFVLMKQSFELKGTLRWTLEENFEVYSYGVAFKIKQEEEGRLAPIINRMTTLHNNHEKIQDTPFTFEDIEAFFKKR